MKYSDLDKVIEKREQLSQVRAGLQALGRGNVKIRISPNDNFKAELPGLDIVNNGADMKASIVQEFQAAETRIIGEIEGLGVTFQGQP